MRRRISVIHALAFTCIFATSLSGQEATPEAEVRVAIPFIPDTPPAQAPAALPRETPAAVEIRRAEPIVQKTPPSTPIVETEIPAATPLPVESAPPEPAPTPNLIREGTPNLLVPPKPFRPLESSEEQPAEPEVEATPTPDERGTIRIGPSTGAGLSAAAGEQLDVANGFYSRKAYDLAMPEYEKFLRNYPTATGRQSALFRLGECYRAQGNSGVAIGYYQKVLTEYTSGEFTGAASYRLAEIYFAQKRYEEAITLYRKAAANAKNADLTLSARYFEARGLEETGRRAEARLVFQDIVAVQNRNPYKTAARLALARYAEDSGAKQEALELYAKLAQETERNELRGESLIHAGGLAADLGDKAKAKAYYQRAIEAPGTGNWRPLARLGMMKLCYDSGDYAAAISMFESGAANQGGVTPAEVLVLAANAYRQLNRGTEAADLYQQVITNFPGSSEAREAGYQRLLALADANNSAVISAINDYLGDSPEGERSDKARLLKAEYFYKNKRYPEAAKVYEEVALKISDQNLKAECLYRAGWSYGQAELWPKVIDAMGTFVEAFPTNDNAPKALLQRGFASLKLNAYTDAMRDFDKLLKDYPKAPERESGMLQKALAEGQQEDNTAMAETFRKLLKDYPKTKSLGLANYYIGWATFETKNYADSIDPLTIARDQDPKSYFDEASIRIILANYYLERLDALSREIDYYKVKGGKRGLPGEIYSFLGVKYYQAGNMAKAARYLAEHIANIPGDPDPEIYYLLGDAYRQSGEWDKAKADLDLYLAKSDAPNLKARGLLAYSKMELSRKNFDEARKRCSEALNLQPEGRANAEGRMQAGDIDFAENKFEDAAKNYLSISVLYDDSELTPLALDKAYAAYTKAGNASEAEKAKLELQDRYPEYKSTLAKK